jgi:hypothetical protein
LITGILTKGAYEMPTIILKILLNNYHFYPEPPRQHLHFLEDINFP